MKTELAEQPPAFDWDALPGIDGDTGEVLDEAALAAAQQQAVAALAADLDGMIDRYAVRIRDLEANAGACHAEAQRYMTRHRIWGNKAKRAKEWLAMAMLAAGRTRVGTALTTAAFQKHGGVVPIDYDADLDMATVPDEFCETKRHLDTAKVREALESGRTLAFARLGERGTSLRLK